MHRRTFLTATAKSAGLKQGLKIRSVWPQKETSPAIPTVFATDFVYFPDSAFSQHFQACDPAHSAYFDTAFGSKDVSVVFPEGVDLKKKDS